MCGNARRRGREVCQTPLLPKDRIEQLIADRIKQYILTEENIEDLVRLTNEELAQACGEGRERLELLQLQISEVEGRLSRLYDALETGQFAEGELAPRIQELFARKEALQHARIEAEQSLHYGTIQLSDRQVLREYVRDMKALLEDSSVIRRKTFLRSFVKSIEVGRSEARVQHTFPMLPDSGDTETVAVLPFIQNGSLFWIRTDLRPG